MNVAFEEPYGFLSRRVITKRIVYLRIDQAGDCGGAVGIDDNITVFGLTRVDRAHLNDLAVLHQN